MAGEVSSIFQDLIINLSHCVPARGPTIQDFNLCWFAMLESSGMLVCQIAMLQIGSVNLDEIRKILQSTR